MVLNNNVWENMSQNGISFEGSNFGTLLSASPISFSERILTLGSIERANQLPISLSYFKAQPKNNKVELTWATVSEQNNGYFTVERSIDGNTDETVLNQKGAGNSTSLIN